jgi:DNA-binding MarR family transcriptional regulator
VTELSGEVIRRLLYRRDVALARQRSALARSLALTDGELTALVHLGEQGELSPSQIAALMDLSSGGVTALVQRLERAGHVTRQRHPSDRRSMLIRLAPATAARLADAQGPLTEGLDGAVAELSDGERTAVGAVFGRLAELSEELAASLRAGAEGPHAELSRPVPSLWA